MILKLPQVSEHRLVGARQCRQPHRPRLPGCHTWGETVEAALSMAHSAVASHGVALRDGGEEDPVEGESPLVTLVDIDLCAAENHRSSRTSAVVFGWMSMSRQSND